MARKRNAALAFALSAALALGTIPAPALAEMAEEAMGAEPVATSQTGAAKSPSATQPAADAEAQMGEEPVVPQPQQAPTSDLAAPADPVSTDAQLAPEAELAPEAAPATDAEPAPELVTEAEDVPVLTTQAMRFSGSASTISVGNHNSAVVKSDGSVWTWGLNGSGQLGDGTYTSRRRPVKVMDGAIAVETDHYGFSAALKPDGSLWMWGSNHYGQLGDGTKTGRNRPAKAMDNVQAFALGTCFTAALKTDGSLWTWGANTDGQIGDGTTTHRYRPIKIMDNVTAISACGFSGTAIKTDGSLWTWGNSTSGSRPVKVMDGVVAAATHGTRTAALKADGSLWMWGNNTYGSIGDGTTTNRTSPVKVMDGVKAIPKGDCSAAIKFDGTLWTWGWNGSGALGDGTTTNRYRPVKVMDGVAAFSSNVGSSGAIKTDGTVWTWGNNYNGSLGDGTSTDRHSPVKVTDSAMLPIDTTQPTTVLFGTDWSAVFDPDWYAQKNPDVARWATSADGSTNWLKLIWHFVSSGCGEGRSGRQSFELASYYNANPDLRRAFGNDWARYYDHYRSSGQREGRTCSGVTALRGMTTSRDGVDWSPVYDPGYYAQNNPDVVGWATRRFASGSVVDDAALLQHFVSSGTKECRSGRSSFDVRSYYNANADLRAAFGGTADWTRYYRHYATNGRGEGRACRGVDQLRGSVTSLGGTDWSPVYDRWIYAERNGDVVGWATRKCGSATVLDDYALLSHFVNNGRKEGRRSKATFELASYYNANPDLRRAFGTDWGRYYDHYRSNGQREGRTANNFPQLRGAATAAEGVDWAPAYDAVYYANNNPDVASWARRSFASGSVLDDAALLSHFVNNGAREARRSKFSFEVRTYRAKNADLDRAFGNDWKSYYRHYALYGSREGRACS